MVDDAELLRRFAESGSQPAFGELLKRHLGLVYHAALRRTGGNATLAEEIAQMVFIETARNAETLAKHVSLVGWLYTTTRNVAANQLRAEQRRRRIEETAVMHELTTSTPALQWERIRPVIDDALDELEPTDRDAILVRFFEGRSFAEVGSVLRISQDAARMRVDRALEKLREPLERRGIASISAALAGALATQSALAVPAATVATISAATVGVTSAGAVGVLVGFMSTTKFTLAAAGVITLFSTALLLRERSAMTAELRQVQAQLAQSRDDARRSEVRALEAERDTGKLLEAMAVDRPKSVGTPPRVAPAEDLNRGEDSAFVSELMAKAKSHKAADELQRAQMANKARHLDPAAAFELRLAGVDAQIAQGNFEFARARFNDAMGGRPVDWPSTERLKQVQASLQEQTDVWIDVTLMSDGQTMIGLWSPSQALTVLRSVARQGVKLSPGNYEVIGRRKGFQDVVIPLKVRNGMASPVVNVSCTVLATP